MQSWEDYEADYYGGFPAGRMGREWETDDRLCPVDRWGNRMCAADRGMRSMSPGVPMGNRTGNEMNSRMRGEMRNMYPEMRMSRENMMEPDDRQEMDEEIRRDLDEFESLFDDAAMEILRVIRELCDSMDGDGCIAMDGGLNRGLVDMLVDRVMEEMERMNEPDGRMPGRETLEANSTELSGENVNRDPDIRRSWISALLFHELLRRRMRHRRRRRNRPDFRDRWKR